MGNGSRIMERNPAEVGPLDVGFGRTVNASQFCVFPDGWSYFTAVGRAALPVTPLKVSVDRAGNKRLSGNRFGAGPAILPVIEAEAFLLADRTSEALEAINDAQALAERFEHRIVLAGTAPAPRCVSRGFGCRRDQIEASFCKAIKIAKEQKSVSLEKRAEEPTQNIAGKKRAGQQDRIPITTLLMPKKGNSQNKINSVSP